MKTSDRLMILPIEYGLMLAFMRGTVRLASLDLPEDAEVVDVNDDPRMGRAFLLTIHSESFERVPLGQMLPMLPPLLVESVKR